MPLQILGFEGFLAIRLREAATARISDARAAIPRLARPASPCCSSARSGAGPSASRENGARSDRFEAPNDRVPGRARNAWTHAGSESHRSIRCGRTPPKVKPPTFRRRQAFHTPAATPAICGHANLEREPTSEPIVRGQLADYWSPK